MKQRPPSTFSPYRRRRSRILQSASKLEGMNSKPLKVSVKAVKRDEDGVEQSPFLTSGVPSGPQALIDEP